MMFFDAQSGGTLTFIHVMRAGYAFVSMQTEQVPGLSRFSFSEASYTASFPKIHVTSFFLLHPRGIGMSIVHSTSS
jgi:hypothetical protein